MRVTGDIEDCPEQAVGSLKDTHTHTQKETTIYNYFQ